MVDLFLGALVLLLFAVSLLTLVNDGVRNELAHRYARQLRLTAEDDCPGILGKPFWFECASEVRRLNTAPPAALPTTR